MNKKIQCIETLIWLTVLAGIYSIGYMATVAAIINH